MSIASMELLSTSATILRIASHYSTYVAFITFSAGIVGNIINILIFTHLKFFRSNRCIFYLTIESISDIIFGLFSIISTIFKSLYGNNLPKSSLVWCRLSYILGQSCALISFSMICFAAADQFFSTNYRLNLRQMCTSKLAWHLVFIINTIWLVHSILFSFFVNVVSPTRCAVLNPALIQYTAFFFYPVLAGLLPIVIASLFSLLAFRNVRRIVRLQIPVERRRFDRQITAMVLIRVVFFVFFALPYIIYNIYIIYVTERSTNPLKLAIAQLIQVTMTSVYNLNYTINFYIFIASSSRYRSQVKYVLIKKYWQRWKSWCCIKGNEVRPKNAVSTNSNNNIE